LAFQCFGPFHAFAAISVPTEEFEERLILEPLESVPCGHKHRAMLDPHNKNSAPQKKPMQDRELVEGKSVTNGVRRAAVFKP
jgi:hypothetical protein